MCDSQQTVPGTLIADGTRTLQDLVTADLKQVRYFGGIVVHLVPQKGKIYVAAGMQCSEMKSC